YVNEHAAPGAHVYRRCIEPVHLAWFRQDLWPTMTETTSAADWIVAYSTVHCAMPKTFHAVYTVDFDGTTLATVYQR
ncbi:MAG TPA: hypothetical protein VGO00_20820, partial [Kofleriaceae bacterium]|nr:hypothetical protein [Kofleriaceae bacterium]